MPALDISAADDLEFVAAWKLMEARGFQWSEGNVEKAHLGWLMARADILALAEENKRMREALEDTRISILCAAGVDDNASEDEADSHIMSWGRSAMSVSFGKINEVLGKEKT